MGRVDQCGLYIKEGKTPGQVALELNLNFGTVIGYVERAIGERAISRSEVLLNIWDALAHELNDGNAETGAPSTDRLPAILRLPPIAIRHARGDFDYILQHGYSTTVGTELFQKISSIERNLHSVVSSLLISYHGEGDDAWWTNGVPARIREACERWRSSDTAPSHPFTYTSLTHLGEIIAHGWSLFEPHLPLGVASDTFAFQDALAHIKGIRNRLAHPVRPFVPDRSDFVFVTSWGTQMQTPNWRSLPSVEHAVPA